MNKIFQCIDVSKTFELDKSPVKALKKIRYETNQNSTLGVIGPSGCGISTLLNLLAGLDDPSRGEIKYKNCIKKNCHICEEVKDVL